MNGRTAQETPMTQRSHLPDYMAHLEVPPYKVTEGAGQGGSGITTGASNRAGGGNRGAVHLFNPETGRTPCGRGRLSYGVRTERLTPDRVLTCPRCRKAAGLKTR